MDEENVKTTEENPDFPNAGKDTELEANRQNERQAERDEHAKRRLSTNEK